MDRTSLRTDLKASLHDAADVLTDPGDFDRALDTAAQAITSKRPNTKAGELTLEADQAIYSGVPSDLALVKASPWGYMHKSRRTPWQVRSANGPLPIMSVFNDAGARKFRLDPAPTSEQIALYGSAYPYYYYAAHVVSDTPSETTIAETDRWLLILRAQIELLGELMARNFTKPVDLRGGQIGGTPSNSSPGALRDALWKQYLEAR